MPYSLETDRAFTKYPNEVLLDNELNADDIKLIEINVNDFNPSIHKINKLIYTYDENVHDYIHKYLIYDNELFTKLFANFKFTKDLFEDETEDIAESELKKEIGDDETEETEEKEPVKETKTKRINKKRVRKLIYTSTVEIDGVEYRFFKRGASKARTANVIFCKADYWNELLQPSLLGLKFKEGELYDITSKEAYTSLIMSGIIGKITITRDQILIISDLNSPKFKAKQTKTILEDGQAIQKEDDYWIQNNMTDGEGLMDESIYLENEILNEATCSLLRNDFLKCNAVRTKLQEYYKKHKITKVWDMYRGWVDASTIRLVITPSSCKYLKFADQFNSEKDCYLDWLKRIPEDFGLVKIDHVGNYGFSNSLSYQMWNSMNLTKNEVKTLMQDELDYFKLLKDNTLVDSDELNTLSAKKKTEERAKRNEMSYFLKYINDTNEELDLKTSDMLSALLNKNSDFRFTTKFKDWKNEQLQDYIENLRLGKVRIQNSIYAIMVSCPYEMLVATTKEGNVIEECIMTGWECYNPHYPENTEFLVIRNPHINQGSVGYMVNKYHDEYKWFGYQVKDENGKMIHKHDFVVFVNSYDVDIMNLLAGCDWDIDSCYMSDNSLLVKKAKESQVYATSVNGIEGEKEKKEYSANSLSTLDNYLGGSTMSIGKVVNKSAIFNSYMYNAINTGKYNEDYINKCYEASSTLSSLSQISIDMAKKSFVDDEGKPLSLTKIMNQLNQKTYKYQTIENDIKVEKEGLILQYKTDKEDLSEIDILKFNSRIHELIKLIYVYSEKENKYIHRYLVYNKKEKVKEDIVEIDILKFDKNRHQIIKLIYVYSERENKYKHKYLVINKKMVVPYFFKYIAKNNDYRIPTYFECGMDYLERFLDKDNLKTKAMATDIEKIENLVNPQSNFKGGAYSKTKIDDARRIIDNCQSILNNNRPKANDNSDEKKKKANINHWAKQTAVSKLKELKLNDKTILRIILRAFNIDTDYKGNKLKRENDKGEEITYINYDYEFDEDEIEDTTDVKFYSMVREFKEMAMLTLTLMYNTNPKTFIECFKKKKSKKIEIEDFWK